MNLQGANKHKGEGEEEEEEAEAKEKKRVKDYLLGFEASIIKRM